MAMIFRTVFATVCPDTIIRQGPLGSERPTETGKEDNDEKAVFVCRHGIYAHTGQCAKYARGVRQRWGDSR